MRVTLGMHTIVVLKLVVYTIGNMLALHSALLARFANVHAHPPNIDAACSLGMIPTPSFLPCTPTSLPG